MGQMYLKVLIIMIALFVFMIPGFILKKCKMVGEGGAKTLSNLLLYVCQPALAVNAFCVFTQEDYTLVYSMNMLRLLRNFALCAAISVIACFVLFLICKIIFIKWKKRGDANIFSYVTIFSNCGFLGLPFIAAFTDGNALASMYMMVFNIVFLAFSWTIGVYLITGSAKYMSVKKIVLHPAILASVFALILFFVPKINFFMFDALTDFQMIPKYLSNMTAPLSMIIVGIRMADVNIKMLFCNAGIYFASFLKLIVAPAITLCIGLAFKSLLIPGESMGYEEYVYLAPVIAMAMSPAAAVVAMAESFGGDKELATCTFITGTLLSVVIIPLTVSLIMLTV